MSRAPSSPASTGQVPTFRHAAAAALSGSGGSIRLTNSPPAARRMVWAETSERSMTSSRLGSVVRVHGREVRDRDPHPEHPGRDRLRARSTRPSSADLAPGRLGGRRTRTAADRGAARSSADASPAGSSRRARSPRASRARPARSGVRANRWRNRTVTSSPRVGAALQEALGLHLARVAPLLAPGCAAPG